jgi:hypothetical protein
MTVMYHARVDWSGFPGAPGFTNLYAETTDPLLAGAETWAAAIDTMINHWANTLPNGVHIQVNPEIETINDADGTLEDILTVTGTLPSHNGALGGNYAGASGWCIDWLTTGAAFGRRRMGRSFVVPASTEAFQNDGTIATATLTEQRAAAATYVATAGINPVVWVRPKYVKPATTPPTLVHAGLAVAITGSRVPDLAAVLRSRRD